MPLSESKFFLWLAENAPPGGWTDEQRELIRIAWNGATLTAARICDAGAGGIQVHKSYDALIIAATLIREQLQ